MIYSLLCSILQFALVFPFLRLLLFSIRENDLSHFTFYCYFLLLRKNLVNISYASLENFEKLDLNFTISDYLAWTLTCYTLTKLNILRNNIAHSPYLCCLWDMPDCNKKSEKLYISFWWNPSILFSNSIHKMKSNKIWRFSGKNVLCSNSLS